MKRLLAAFCVLAALAGTAVAAPTFPALTGRVVDDAGIILDSDPRNMTQAGQAQHAPIAVAAAAAPVPADPPAAPPA